MPFDTPGWGDFQPAQSTETNKRKRPSSALDIAAVNMDKLMANLEKEERANKNTASKAKAESKKPDQPSKPNPNAKPKPNSKNKKNGPKAKAPPAASTPANKDPLPTPSKAAPVATSTEPAVSQTSEPPLKKSKKSKKSKATDSAAPVSTTPAAPTPAAGPKDDAVMEETGVVVEEANTVMIPLEDESALAGDKLQGLTPMQAKMKKKLAGARFRWINEQLYTTSSASALEMMKADPDIFSDYHQGFRSQTQTWPQSPVALITSQLQSALPPASLIIDLGCGDAELAKVLVPKGFKVLSYDLVPDEWVVRGDFCEKIDLPGGEGEGRALGSEVVDAAVCSLSLMGRNWVKGIREIARVSKDGARLEIAEVKSRMSSVEAFTQMVSSFGFNLTRTDDSNTHFVYMSFVRSGTPSWDKEGSVEWDDVLKEGEAVLKACVYKKR